MEEQGLVETPRPRKAPARHGKSTRQAKKARSEPRERPVVPATKKAEKLLEIAEALRRGEDFSIARLTVLKGLCEDRRAAGEFAQFLARKAQRRLRGGPERCRKLVDRAIQEMKYYLADPADGRKDGLYDLLREMQSEQDEYKDIAWGSVRLIKSMDLLVAEECLESVPRPHEPATWL